MSDETWTKHPTLPFELSSKGGIRRLDGAEAKVAGGAVRTPDKSRKLVAALVAETFLGKDPDSKVTVAFRSGDESDCSPENLFVFDRMVPRSDVAVRNGVVGLRCACGGPVPVEEGAGLRPRARRRLCPDCSPDLRKNASQADNITDGKGRLSRKCICCKRVLPLKEFCTEGSEGPGSVRCEDCRNGTGIFQAGRKTTLHGARPDRRPIVIPRASQRPCGTRVDDPIRFLVERLERGDFPYQTEGKLGVLERIGRTVRERFGGPARMMLMPNLGMELAKYIQMEAIELNHSILVERDPLIASALRSLARRSGQYLRVHEGCAIEFAFRTNNRTSGAFLQAAHLDFNCHLTAEIQDAALRLVERGKLVFVTTKLRNRWRQSNEPTEPIPSELVVWEQQYSGNRGTPMITRCLAFRWKILTETPTPFASPYYKRRTESIYIKEGAA